MGRKTRLRKDTDYETRFRCGKGIGVLREEVWVNEDDKIVRYNLAFLLPHVTAVDNGRVLGFDNAHGVHERHFMGAVEPTEFDHYLTMAKRFYREVQSLRAMYEEEKS